MEQLSISVVVNTHNRGPHLKRLLDSLCRQTYENFEVIVVNGPSTDNTEEVLKQYGNAIRTARCEHINLCESRNIGVRMAAGDIVAFIDDDAVPQSVSWLENAAKLFQNSKVAIVGGKVLHINGDMEFRYGTFDIWGHNIGVNDTPEYLDDPYGEIFNGVQGCNCFFRYEALRKVGAFDEYYVYFLDESDLCMRIIQKGYVTRYGENMAVIHEAAGGANRKSPYHKNWYTICRSQGYFVMKASVDCGKSEEERRKMAVDSTKHWVSDMKWLAETGKLTAEESRKYIEDIERGVNEGIEDGVGKDRTLLANLVQDPIQFKRYNKKVSDDVMNICLICEGETIHPVGGVPVYTKALAEGLSAAGHNVFVINKGDEEKLELINGYNLCTIVPTQIMMEELDNLPNGQARVSFSAAVHKKVEQLKGVFGVQIVESPIWDSLGVISAYMEHDIPVVTRLQTPLKMVMETFKKDENNDLEFLMGLEELLMKRSDSIITISECVRMTIEDLYGFKFTQPVYKNYLGFPRADIEQTTRKKNDDRVIVFFVGRLERRKGIDNIITVLPNLLIKYPTLEFHLAGDSDIVDDVIGMTYKQKVLSEYADAPWLDRVKFLGKISEKEKEQEFADCDIFLSPSLYESFGIIFVEAMRVAKPVIGCRVGGMQEVIEDGVNGLLAEPGDANSLENCLIRLLDDSDLRHQMGEAGLTRYQNMFTTEAMCKECEAIYRSIIDKYKKMKSK